MAAIVDLDEGMLSEVSIFHKLGEAEDTCFYEVRLLPFLDDQVFAIVRDITKRKQAERALQASQQKLREKTHRLASAIADLKDTQTQLVQTEKMSGLGQLVAGIAHEIDQHERGEHLHDEDKVIVEYEETYLQLRVISLVRWIFQPLFVHTE